MIIQELDGTVIDTSKFNLKRLFHHVPSANINHDSASVEGRYDELYNSKLNNRNIRVEFLYDTEDIYDFYLLRDQLNDIFMRVNPFYIIFKKEPYKRWLVKTANQFEVPPNPHMQSFVVEFITLNAYAESIISTGDFPLKEWDVDKFAWNGTIEWDSDYSYSFNQPTFTVINAGNVKIDPRNSDLKIDVIANGNKLGLRNLTNGDYYEFNGRLTEEDILTVEGVRTFKNNVSSFSQTNKKLISLEPGENKFAVENADLISVNFDFKFLYK